MSSLAISNGGRPLEQRSSSTTASSLVDAINAPQIRTSRRAAAAFSLGRQPEESVTRCKQTQCGDTQRHDTVFIVQSDFAAALPIRVMTRSSNSLRRDHWTL